MYTVVYFGTIYVYRKRPNLFEHLDYSSGGYVVTNKSSKNRFVPAAITMLYVSSIAGTAIQWYATNLEFVDNGATRASVFISLYEGPQWLFIAFGASSYTVFVIADGLLVRI
jgi:hypothetical protein